MSGVVVERAVEEFDAVTALKLLDPAVEEGEFLTLLGPSGCGKTTTPRSIAGFIRPSSGNLGNLRHAAFFRSSDVDVAPGDDGVEEFAGQGRSGQVRTSSH